MTAPKPIAPPDFTPTPSAVRWHRYSRRGLLTCPVGHHIPNENRAPESMFSRCARWTQGAGECNRWVYIYQIRGGLFLAVEVRLDELRELEQLATPAEVVERLGISGSGEQIQAHGAHGSPLPHPATRPPRRDHRGR